MPSKTDKHMPEPWGVANIDCPQNGNTIISIHKVNPPKDGSGAVAWMSQGDKKANARRIVACVNACAGVTTKWLEENPGEVAHMGVNAHGQHRRQVARQPLDAKPAEG